MRRGWFAWRGPASPPRLALFLVESMVNIGLKLTSRIICVTTTSPLSLSLSIGVPIWSQSWSSNHTQFTLPMCSFFKKEGTGDGPRRREKRCLGVKSSYVPCDGARRGVPRCQVWKLPFPSFQLGITNIPLATRWQHAAVARTYVRTRARANGWLGRQTRRAPTVLASARSPSVAKPAAHASFRVPIGRNRIPATAADNDLASQPGVLTVCVSWAVGSRR